jgi:hypothetical protein
VNLGIDFAPPQEPRVCQMLEDAEDDIRAFHAFPVDHG